MNFSHVDTCIWILVSCLVWHINSTSNALLCWVRVLFNHCQFYFLQITHTLSWRESLRSRPLSLETSCLGGEFCRTGPSDKSVTCTVNVSNKAGNKNSDTSSEYITSDMLKALMDAHNKQMESVQKSLDSFSWESDCQKHPPGCIHLCFHSKRHFHPAS
jgi:hypothetical protein